MAMYAESGYFGARVDSVDTALKQVRVDKGIVARVGGIDVEGASNAVDVPGWIEGAVLTQENLEMLADDILFSLSKRGFLAATTSVVGIDEDGGVYRVRLAVHAGVRAIIEDVVFEGDSRSLPAYRLRVSGVRPGMAADAVNLDRIRRRVAAAGRGSLYSSSCPIHRP